MFSVIVPPIHSGNSWFHRLNPKNRVPVPVEIHCDRMNSVYYLIELKKYHSPESLRNLAWVFRGGLIASPQIKLPEALSRYQISTQPFQEKIAENTVKYLLQKSYPTPYLQQLGIIDEKGVCLEMAERFVRICPHVRIFTQNMQAYQPFLHQMMQEYGASVIVTENLSALQPCNLIFCPKDFSWKEPIHLKAPVLCGGSCQITGSTLIIHSLQPQLDSGFLQEIPENITPLQFASAFYHAQPSSFLEGCRAELGTCRKNHPKTEEISRYIRTLLDKPAHNKKREIPL